jgi:cysteine-S-conjugate beta-lyase
MKYDFDNPPDRRNSDSDKWNTYGEDVLPLWISDMDFVSPPAVIDALRERAEHGVFGLPVHPPEELCGLLIQQMAERYDWHFTMEDILVIPGTHDGFKYVFRMIGQPGDEVLMHTPMYYPLLKAPANVEKVCQTVEMVQDSTGQYTIDFETFQSAITDRTSVYLLCNPNNPTGRVYTRMELEKLAEGCLRRNVVICSDDVHYDLVYPGNHRYIPIASLDPEIANHTITLTNANKAFNLGGLRTSFAIIPNPELRQAIRSQMDDYPATMMGIVAATAAYRDGKEWYEQLMAYLESNRDLLADFVRDHLPGIKMAKPEASYLAWLDCRGANLPGAPAEFFLEKAKVAVGAGESFGPGGEGFVRLNFGCSRSVLQEALERMRAALEAG